MKEYKNGWIPCSDNLPESLEYVLAWCKGRIVGGACDGEEYQWYGLGFISCGRWNVSYIHMKNIEVVAWQPLPEPYNR